MDYPFENLGPERFQLVCQALLAKEYPRIQCFPVAQPDGGRDAVYYHSEDGGNKFIVFQVKYARNPQIETEPHKWLTAIMKEEAPKVKDLIPRGAAQYVLLTNVPGTAHFETGSIDKLNKLLTADLGLPAQCWWRNDINRRLDSAWDIKWAYPDIMAGPDFLRAIFESGITESRERRSCALRAFLRSQFDMDEEVRFKQVELQNKLLDLFIDVPITLRDQHADRRANQIFETVAQSVLLRREVELEEIDSEAQQAGFEWGAGWHTQHHKPLGAATLLLSAPLQRRMPKVVVEGAPGQGKSTIAQYVCQVHRMKLLKEVNVLASLPQEHAEAPVRLPIKVDLRDFALWLARKDPFNVDQGANEPPNWNKSLESFLAALISNHSGGTQFGTDDLLAVFRISSTLIAFDGLDEVADMTRRHEVVNEIVRGVQRLEANAASMQTIVTSRPAAFANSPGMPSAKYLHLQLLSLNPSLIMDYAERWLRARRLDSKQSAEFRSILKDKLDQPHLRDLGRNPMQLTILLSLVHTRGASLPDKRTALYDYYIDLFFGREAGKSQIVREHRDLLIDIHRHLAWIIHSEAEQEGTGGSVPQERLQQMVAEYLSKEGHDPELAKELFTGMVERVVALVSRVEGTFEFEVQPLREYFAACHLYYTAPQSSPGKERPGSKPDRFDALARNFYWLNVTRFYAGCYSKGELPSLVERLQELRDEDGFRFTSFPRILAANLLSDWVFTQNPKSIQQAVELILDARSLRYVLSQSDIRRSKDNALVLPPRCGREELVKRCFEILAKHPPSDIVSALLRLLDAYTESGSDLRQLWMEYFRGAAGLKKQLRWLDYGVQLRIVPTLQRVEVESLVVNTKLLGEPTALALLFRARRLDVLHSSESLFEAVMTEILDLRISVNPVRRVDSPLDALSHALNGFRYASAFSDRQPASLEAHLERTNRGVRLNWSAQFVTGTETYTGHRLCLEIAKIAEDQSKRSTIEWATNLNPWNTVIEAARSVWGERWAITNLANISAGIKSTSDKCADCPELLDPSRSLARRARYARLRSSASKWWEAQLASASSDTEIMLVLLIASTWNTVSTIVANAEPLDAALARLDQKNWRSLFMAVRRCVAVARSREESSEDLGSKKLPANMSQRLVCLLAERVTPAGGRVLYKTYIEASRPADREIHELIQLQALDLENFGKASWSPNVDEIKRCYKAGIAFEPSGFHLARNHRELNKMPVKIASEVLAAPDQFPSFLLAYAEERYRQEVASRIVPVAAIAEKEGWFSM